MSDAEREPEIPFAGKNGKELMIKQGYLPPKCTLPDLFAVALAMTEIRNGRDPCWGCNMDRSVCDGKPKLSNVRR